MSDIHRNHGRGDAEFGPYEPDCYCRMTPSQAACAKSGCGFCQAAQRPAKRQAPSSARVLGCCGLAASLLLVGGLLAPAGVVMAAANVYALVRG